MCGVGSDGTINVKDSFKFLNDIGIVNEILFAERLQMWL